MPRGNRTRSPSTSAPASFRSSSASGASAEVDPDRSRIVSALLLDRLEPLLRQDLEGRQRARDERDPLGRRRRRGRPGGRRGRRSAAAGAGFVAHAVLLSRCRRRRRRGRVGALAGRPSRRARAAPRPRRAAGTARSRAGSPSRRRNAPGTAARRAVSIFSTRRTTSSISARAAPVQQRDPRAGPGGVAGGRHVRRVAVGHEPEHHRVHGVDVRAERAGQPDPVDALDAVGGPSAAGSRRRARPSPAGSGGRRSA